MRSPRHAFGLAALVAGLALAGCSAAPERQDAALASVAGVRLAPDPAFASSRLSVEFDDPDRSGTGAVIEWRRNGRRMPDATGLALDPGVFTRGDVIEAIVSLPGADRPLRAQRRISNSPPRVQRVTVRIAPSGSTTEWQAQAECVDPDGDHLSVSWHWYRNGELVPNVSGDHLPGTAAARGDRVEAEAIANDGEAESTPLRSAPVALENHPPEFTSQATPPAPADAEFRYQAVAADPDGDPVRFELLSGPAGMTMDASGALQWTLPPAAERNGEYTVRIAARDASGGEATQEFTLRLAPATPRQP
jgi:hypothetical protein